MSQSDHSTWEKARTLPEQEFTTPWLLNQSIVECTERMQHPPEPLQTEPFLSWLYFQGVCDCQYLHYVSASLIFFFFSSIKSYGLVQPFFFLFIFFVGLFHLAAAPTITAAITLGTLVPDSATSAMSTPCSCAMKPRTENIAKPDTKLVPLLRPPSSKQSLCHTYVMEVVNEHRRNRGSHFFFFSRNSL